VLRRVAAGAAAALAALCAGDARATWSIVAVDPATREVGAAVASCFVGVHVVVGLAPGRGAVVAQAWTNPWARDRGVELLRAGASAEEVVRRVGEEVDEAGPWWGSAWARQQFAAAALDPAPTSAAHTGERTVAWQGARSAAEYSVQGNMLVDESVVAAAFAAYPAAAPPTAGRCVPPLAERLLAALEAGAAAGGDNRCPADRAALDAFLVVARPADEADRPALALHAPRRYSTANVLRHLVIAYRPAADEPPPVALLRERLESWRDANPDAWPRCEGEG
jgi:uncharacterized Ntn-hydrolase superfamily protein